MIVRNMEQHKVEKKWGHEIWFANNELYCGKELYCAKNVWSSGGLYHYHPIKDETFYVISGALELDIEGTLHLLNEGDSIRIKPGVKHRFRSYTDECFFIEASTNHSEEDSIRVEEL